MIKVVVLELRPESGLVCGDQFYTHNFVVNSLRATKCFNFGENDDRI